MTLFRRILFPFDFSEAAQAMLPSVRTMSQHFGASVTVLSAFHFAPDYVVAPRFDAASGAEAITIPYLPEIVQLRDRHAERLQRFVREHLEGTKHKFRIEDGEPASVIEWVAKHEGSDLIMMPTRGMGRFRRMLLGSVTAKVLHDLECPIFTSAHVAEINSAPEAGYQSILCAVSMDPESETVMKVAANFAESWGARICLLHIDPSGKTEDNQVAIRRLRHAFEHCLDTKSELRSSACVLTTGISEGIRKTVIKESADLVIVGRGHFGDEISRVWSHVYGIIRESPCPVLSVA